MQLNNNSITKRYFYKLFTNFIIIPINILFISQITRELGPAVFGEYKLVLYIFSMFASFISFGGNYFTTELSKNNFNKELISFYFILNIVFWFIGLILLLLIYFTGLGEYLYSVDLPLQILILAFVLTVFTSFAQILESMNDACGLTQQSAVINLFSKIFNILMLFFLVFYFKNVTIVSIFIISILSSFILLYGFYKILKINNFLISFNISLLNFKSILKNYLFYSLPLLTIATFVLPVGIINRIILQNFGGSLQQGYFSLSDTFSAFIIIFSNSFSPLLQREFSISFYNNEKEKIKSFMLKSIYIFFIITTYFAMYTFTNITLLTKLLGGEAFKDSILPTKIMLFYPIPYIINNILTSSIYAIGNTKILRNIQIITTILSLILTFYLLAPTKFYGLDLGAVGFAYSILISTLINHFILLRYCSNEFALNFKLIILKYFLIFIGFLLLSELNTFIYNFTEINFIIKFLISGTTYTILSFILTIGIIKILRIEISIITKYISYLKFK